ncbi:MAG: 2-phospho-L-lactate/phosphoenolpyruvate guanylyltransferase [Acidimicrobiaceae bacterium]|nr:2-phospho-L-lactate/phosphoenolpyruvate guanylyltransferase [Acidimicrobiaceae bacterium]
MQATVRSFDPDTQDGELLLDDGSPLSFSGRAFATSGLRLLRLGQRVRIEMDASGEVTRVTLATLP